MPLKHHLGRSSTVKGSAPGRVPLMTPSHLLLDKVDLDGYETLHACMELAACCCPHPVDGVGKTLNPEAVPALPAFHRAAPQAETVGDGAFARNTCCAQVGRCWYRCSIACCPHPRCGSRSGRWRRIRGHMLRASSGRLLAPAVFWAVSAAMAVVQKAPFASHACEGGSRRRDCYSAAPPLSL